ncbi:MAG: hypothetical protein PHV42_02445 [Candidatus Pacebacteria bacterium]|nr:hypothetical protein [Candidatus Paceibacterota bacterium]
METNNKKYLLLVAILVVVGFIFIFTTGGQHAFAPTPENNIPLANSSTTPTSTGNILLTPSPTAQFSIPKSKSPVTITMLTTPPSVTLKINASRTPAPVAYNSINTISWASTGNIIGCVSGGYYVPLADAQSTLWSRQGQMKASGSESFVAKMLTGAPPATGYKYFSPLALNIACTAISAEGTKVIVKDEITVSVTP